jgi:hypothetical protein
MKPEGPSGNSGEVRLRFSGFLVPKRANEVAMCPILTNEDVPQKRAFISQVEGENGGSEALERQG